MTKELGRPTLYSRELAELICKRLGDGEPLTTLCEEKEMPCESTVYNWLRGINCPEKEIFLQMYSRARKNQGDAYADATVKIADDLIKEIEEKKIVPENIICVDPIGYSQILSAKTKVAELRMKARHWHAARLRPNKYGDQINTNNKSKVDTKLDLGNNDDARRALFEKLKPVEKPVEVEETK